jgi:hypothetical protein
VTPAEAHKAMLQAWIIGWPLKVGGTQSAPTVPYGIDNRKIAQPTQPPFAIVEITNQDADQLTMGAPGRRRFLRPGWIDVRLYGARDKGRGELDTLAEYVKEIYEAKRLGGTATHYGVVTFATSVRELRDDREFPDLWCVLCRTPFEWHQRR